jgi:hypothetical protein
MLAMLTDKVLKQVELNVEEIREAISHAIGGDATLDDVRSLLDDPTAFDDSDHPSDLDDSDYCQGVLDGVAMALEFTGGALELFDVWRKTTTKAGGAR